MNIIHIRHILHILYISQNVYFAYFAYTSCICASEQGSAGHSVSSPNILYLMRLEDAVNANVTLVQRDGKQAQRDVLCIMVFE